MILIAASGTTWGQTSYPMISRVEPTAVQRGTTTELTLTGAGDFSGASALLVEGTGVTGEVMPPGKVAVPIAKAKSGMKGQPAASAKVKLTVAADASPVIREVRLVTPQGVSSTGLVVVTEDPVVVEADEKANNTAKGAQKLTLPVAVSGKIGAVEDVDWYTIEAKVGQTIAFSLWGNRLENKIHDLQTHLDPILILLDERGREVATDDNSDYADPLLIHTFKTAGNYLLQVRDTNYAGNANWTYVLIASSKPYVTSVFPSAVNPGKMAELKGLGVNFDTKTPLRLDVPGEAPDGPRWFPLASEAGRTQAYPVVVTRLPIAVEVDDAGDETPKAQAVTLPAAICGRLGARNDLDAYRFEAKKGQAYAFEIVARRVKSGADVVLRILDAKGIVVTEVDDSPGLGKDLRVEWTAPSDGTFAVQVGDLHSRGGPNFGYTILAESAKPDFVAFCDPDKINIGPGARMAVYVNVTRRGGFAGPISAAFDGLPAGVQASPLTIPANMSQGVIVVSALKEAKLGGSFIKLGAKAETGVGPIARTVAPYQEIYLPGGGRGRYVVDTIALAVTKPSDLGVEAKPTEVVLKPGESTTIDVTITRQGDYAQGVNLAVNLAHLGQVFASSLPPGVTVKEAGSKTLLGPKETVGKIVLQAAADAPSCEKVPIAVMGHVSINFVVKTAYSSAPILLTIPPQKP